MRRTAITLLVLAAWLLGAAFAAGQNDPLPPPLEGNPGLDPGTASDPSPRDEGPRTPSLAPAPTYEEQLLELVNQVRAACTGYSCSASSCPGGAPRPPVKGEWRLHVAADRHSENMGVRNFHMHCDPDTLTLPWDRVTAAGYSWSSVAENIAAGYPNPNEVMFGNAFGSGWMGSSGHCTNILGSRREIGVGYYLDSGDSANVRQSADGLCPVTSTGHGPYQRYWTQVFASRSTSHPLIIEGEAYLTSSTTVDLYLYSPGGSSPQMRFSDDGESWSPFQPYAATRTWPLPAGDGVKVVYSEFQSSAGTYRSCDRIWLEGSGSVADEIFRDSFECGDDSFGLWSLVAP